MSHYYNEIEPFAAQWLSNLCTEGHIPDGTIDTRSITEVSAEDVRGYTQCHFFAGIAGWSEALRLAGWPADREVWTGSCPCQPFSSAGKRKGAKDERHLWPELYRLISECRPATIFGEQVASKDGRAWLDGISLDLEELGYTVGAADLGAPMVGAPHIRQRLFWVGDIEVPERQRNRAVSRGQQGGPTDCSGLGQSNMHGCESGVPTATTNGYGSATDATGRVHSGLGDTNSRRRVEAGRDEQGGDREALPRREASGFGGASPWSDFDLVRCVEPTKEPGRYVEKRRRVESGTLPLAHGVPNRVGRLRAYGNAIVPQVAAEFIAAYMEST